MSSHTDDLHVRSLRPLLPPGVLIEEIPLSAEQSQNVNTTRNHIRSLLEKKDDRLLVVVGPCSIHDPVAGLDYAQKLVEQARLYEEALVVVMRVYFEKPRTIVGWKGLINDPHLDGSFEINQGLRIARRFLSDVVALGLPAGCEFLDPITPQYTADLVSWGAIGARTTESQVHRELASGLSMPVGFKNGTSGNIQIALDAICSSAHPHHFLGVTKQSVAAIVATSGNPHCHMILRGGDQGPNFSKPILDEVRSKLEEQGLTPRIMVDCSHANSGKDHMRQAEVAAELAQQIAQGAQSIFGVMLESFLEAGRQQQQAPEQLVYGQSITDACMAWDTTARCLQQLAEAVQKRRAKQV
jgi:3-deoxy-7-phosphoheptulonate synthase